MQNGLIKYTHLPVSWRAFFASSKIGRTSLMPTIVALSSLKIELVRLEISRANVVFPQLCLRSVLSCGKTSRLAHPGGPHKIMLPVAPFSARVERKELGPVRWTWPTKSSRVFGLSRSASGDAACRRDAIVCLVRLADVAVWDNCGKSPVVFRF